MPKDIETGRAKTVLTIHYAGDSTVQFNSIETYPQTGLGQVLPLFLKDSVAVKNHGKNGRSTRSFINEGRLEVIDGIICEGDFLFIEFGHNDEKETDPIRFTEPDGEYKENLIKFVKVAEDHKAFPVLITPLERGNFENGHLYEGKHGPYIKSMKEVAERFEVPLVDLNAMSRELMEQLGEEKSHRLFNIDTTHMNYDGAVTFGRLLSKGIRELGGRYSELLIDEVTTNE